MKAEIKCVDYFPETKDKLRWQSIPVEIWVKIFGHFGNLASPQPKSLAKLRLVCKAWRDVIDENLDFDVKLSDTVLKRCTLGHLRVKHFSVHNFRKHLLPHKLLFWDPTLVNSFTLGNNISRENFILLIDHLPNVKCLSVNASFLSSETNLLVPTIANEELIFNTFWNSIKELSFNYDCDNDINSNCWTSNFTTLMSMNMPNLKLFTFNVPLRLIESQLPFLFLLQNPSITDVDFRYCVECRHKYLLPNLQAIKKVKVEELHKIQFRSIKLKVIRLYEYGHLAWLPIIKAQTSLVNLEISQYGSTYLSGNFVAFDELSDMITANQFTLTSLKLENFHFPDNFDAYIFQPLVKLHTLMVHLPQNDSCQPISRIKNLKRLPALLQKLVLQNVSLDREELHKMLSVNYLKKLKYLMLIGLEDSLVISELVNSLGQKTSLEKLILSPVVLDCFRLRPVEKGKHYCLVIDDYLQSVGKYFWLSRRLELNCNVLRHLKN